MAARVGRRVRDGRLGRDGPACVVVGAGRPLLVLPGLGAEHGNPTGWQRGNQLQPVRTLTAQRAVHVVSRGPGLSPTTTLGDLAADLAAGIRSAFDGPVDVLGISTGGVLAQRLAIDHPDVMRRLVLLATGCRLSDDGRSAQGRLGELVAAGRPRRGWARRIMPATRLGGWLIAALLSLLPPPGAPEDPSDLLTVIRAEDACDLTEELHRIAAPTLVVAGGRDRVCGPDLARLTACGIPDAHLALHPRVGHAGLVSSPRVWRQIARFLSADVTGVPSGSHAITDRGRT